MNRDEVLKLAKDNGATESTAGLVLYQSKLLAFANACEQAGMEKAAKICKDLSKEKHKYMLFHESNGVDDCYEAIKKAIE